MEQIYKISIIQSCCNNQIMNFHNFLTKIDRTDPFEALRRSRKKSCLKKIFEVPLRTNYERYRSGVKTEVKYRSLGTLTSIYRGQQQIMRSVQAANRKSVYFNFVKILKSLILVAVGWVGTHYKALEIRYKMGFQICNMLKIDRVMAY